MKSLVRLIVAGLLVVAAQTQAASFVLKTKVAGYPGWITVDSKLRGKLGGRVAYLKQYGGWVTDRVQRGEPLMVTVNPTSRAERQCRGSFVGVDSVNGFFAFTNTRLPYSRTQNVSRDTSFDDVYVWAISEAGYFETRIPIGTRPAR